MGVGGDREKDRERERGHTTGRVVQGKSAAHRQEVYGLRFLTPAYIDQAQTTTTVLSPTD